MGEVGAVELIQGLYWRVSMLMRVRRLLAGLLPALLCGLPALGAAGAPPFEIRIVSPDPLFIVGRTRIEAVARSPEGDPYEGISYMTLAVNGRDRGADSEPPFRWDVEVGPELERHRIELRAVSDRGESASLTLVSAEHAYVEAVCVEMVLVPVVVRDGTTGRVVTGLEATDFTIMENGVAQPLAWFAKEAMPASIVLALDNSRSMEGRFWSAQKAVNAFIEIQPPYSALSLVTFNDQVFLEEGFTHEKSRVARAVGAARPEGTRTALFDALRIGSLHLKRRAGARVLVIFTDGEETVHEGEEGRLRTALDAAQAADVTVFAVAYGPGDSFRGMEPLRRMTSETGGEVVPARRASDLEEAFSRIADALGARYLLGYEPPRPREEGYRRIEVSVSRAGARVLSRRGYRMEPR